MTLAPLDDHGPNVLALLDGRWPTATTAWLAEVQQRSGSVRTPAEYARYVARFLDHVGDPATATPAHVHAFVYAPGPSARAPSPSTVVVRLAALRSFYDFARRMQMVPHNPVDDVRRPRLPESPPRGLDPMALHALLVAIPETPAGLRDHAIILTTVLTALRRSEVMGLTAGGLVPRDGRVFYCVRVKGGRMRLRELPAPALQAIRAVLMAEGRDLATLPEDTRLFSVSAQAFYQNLRRYARTAGLVGVTPHVLRHTAAKLRRQDGQSIEAIQELLGHRSIATTARYLKRMEGERDDGWRGVAVMLGVHPDSVGTGT